MTIEGPFRAVTVLDRVVAISAGPLGCTMRTLSFAVMLVPILSLADVLQCKIEAYNEDIFITTAPNTNQNDGQYARIGISRGIGNRAIVVADRTGAVAIR